MKAGDPAPGKALLDVNVLIALIDAEHVHHRPALEWLHRERSAGWASCPITQNGCLRILSQPAYPSSMPFIAVANALEALTSGAAHAFWPDDVSLLDGKLLRREHIHGHRQLTDLYLLALAVRHGGRFVTLDVSITLSAVRGAADRNLVRLLD